jgi:hypothetical protein
MKSTLAVKIAKTNLKQAKRRHYKAAVALADCVLDSAGEAKRECAEVPYMLARADLAVAVEALRDARKAS